MGHWQYRSCSEYLPHSCENSKINRLEIMRQDSPSGRSVRWRLSVANILENNEFSHYGSHQHILSVMKGHGLALTIDNRPHIDIHPRQILRFSGDSRVKYSLLDGPVEALSLIYDLNHYGARMQWLMARENTQSLRLHASTVILFCQEGEITVTPYNGDGPIVLTHHNSAILLNPRTQTHSIDIQGSGYLSVFELIAFDC